MTARDQVIDVLCATNPDYHGYPEHLKDLTRIWMTPYANAVIDAGFIPAPWTDEQPPFDPWADNFTANADDREAAQQNARDAKAASAAFSELSAHVPGLTSLPINSLPHPSPTAPADTERHDL